MVVIYRDKKIKCKYLDNYIVMNFYLNRKPLEYKIDILKGKYIGANKGENNTLRWKQSQRPFQYD